MPIAAQLLEVQKCPAIYYSWPATYLRSTDIAEQFPMTSSSEEEVYIWNKLYSDSRSLQNLLLWNTMDFTPRHQYLSSFRLIRCRACNQIISSLKKETLNQMCGRWEEPQHQLLWPNDLLLLQKWIAEVEAPIDLFHSQCQVQLHLHKRDLGGNNHNKDRVSFLCSSK